MWMVMGWACKAAGEISVVWFCRQRWWLGRVRFFELWLEWRSPSIYPYYLKEGTEMEFR